MAATATSNFDLLGKTPSLRGKGGRGTRGATPTRPPQARTAVMLPFFHLQSESCASGSILFLGDSLKEGDSTVPLSGFSGIVAVVGAERS